MLTKVLCHLPLSLINSSTDEVTCIDSHELMTGVRWLPSQRSCIYRLRCIHQLCGHFEHAVSSDEGVDVLVPVWHTWCSSESAGELEVVKDKLAS